MKKKLIAGNWKMNGKLQANEALVRAVLAGLPLLAQAEACIIHSQSNQLDVKLCQENRTIPQQLFRNGNLKIFERSQDIAAPSNYILGEGDVIGVSAYGTAFFNNTYTVDSRGFITMEGMGKLQLRGVTFEEATKLVKGMLSRRIDFSSNQFNLTLATSRTLTVARRESAVNDWPVKRAAT